MFANGRQPSNGTFTATTFKTSEMKQMSVETETAPMFDLNTVEMQTESNA